MGSQYGNFHNEEKKEFRHTKDVSFNNEIN